jgi:hypothetical protein
LGIYSFAGRVPRIKGKVLAIHEPKLNSEAKFNWSVKEGDKISQASLTPRDFAGEFYVQNNDYAALYADFLKFRNHQFMEISTFD